ncbi:MAG: deoxyhypusine synthase family protein [Acidobacteria bacterium]|nr:deoxyhypusine synthase family protein [Acidobacteriota bacterium]
MSDEELEGSDVLRLGDVMANREEYQEADEWIGSVINQLELSRPYSIREFLHLLGRELSEIAHEDGILTSAFKSRIPVFCPDLPGSEIAVGIARAKFEKKIQIMFDTTQDTMEMMNIAHKTRHSGIICLRSMAARICNCDRAFVLHHANNGRGDKYAISIATPIRPRLIFGHLSYGGNHTHLWQIGAGGYHGILRTVRPVDRAQ